MAVPGLGLGVEAWRPALEAMGHGDAMVRLLPGYGRPVRSPTPPGMSQLAELLCERLPGPVVLLGHSSSCQLAARAARLRPDLVRRLVLVAPTTDPRATSWPALAGLWLRTAGHEDPRQVPRLLRQYRRTGLRSMLATMDVARRDDVQATLGEVGCPVVLVRGAHDRIARSDWLQRLAGTGPGRTVVELPAGAHMALTTHPRLFAEHVAPAVR